MVARWIGLVIAGGLVAVLVSMTDTSAQYYEDRLEPAEIGIRDLPRMRIPEAAYVGNDECRLCHEAAYQTWLGTRHARSLVSLRSRAAMEMGQKEGITASCPSMSYQCLSCHGTASDVPAAYRGPGFRIGEGVSCEHCHGPGEMHVAAMEQTDPDANPAMRMPDMASCYQCHDPKPSHEHLNPRPFKAETAWRYIAHPLADERPEHEMDHGLMPGQLGIWRLRPTEPPPASYTGSAACGDCHESSYAVWESSAHARATRGLRSEMGVWINSRVDRDVIGGPVKNAACLECHATGHDAPAAFRLPGFSMREGVGCEKCHGPGATHIEAMRQADYSLPQLGLVATPREADCMDCHRPKQSHRVLETPPFRYPEAWKQIAHP